ncbi:MAG: archaea-specific RecJ-like protein exonuclease [archaeon GW2011_AR13]|nr:MAG: archaea-specific RecJ-like protein exonuclease [archaeon GW2011_AR13]
MDKKGLAIGMSNAKQEKMGNVILQSIEIEETFPGFGFFPKPGRATGLVHDEYQKRTGETAVVTAGIMNTAITMRATDEANFSVHELIKFIDKKLPETFVEGGGHKNAGSISFLPNKKNNIVNLLKEFIKSR